METIKKISKKEIEEKTVKLFTYKCIINGFNFVGYSHTFYNYTTVILVREKRITKKIFIDLIYNYLNN